jgi:nicotinate-nucleotide pyrophosphorylase (carboxylating)
MIVRDTDAMENLRRLLVLARAEDLGGGDLTGDILPEGVQAKARFRARQGLVVCGGQMLPTIAEAYDPEIRTRVIVAEGRSVQSNEVLAEWSGPAKSVLAAERVALNFLQRLCGVATTTARYVAAVAGTGAEIYDTRKTTPGWRDLEKYAVRAGGGQNHRRGLYDAVLIKDNHLAVLERAGQADPIGSLSARLVQLRQGPRKPAFVELEVDNLAQFAQALKIAGIDMVLLDNMNTEQIRQAVRMRREAGLEGRMKLEASGGITLANLREVAQTGVERIAVGALTHSAAAVDIGLDIDLE